MKIVLAPNGDSYSQYLIAIIFLLIIGMFSYGCYGGNKGPKLQVSEDLPQINTPVPVENLVLTVTAAITSKGDFGSLPEKDRRWGIINVEIHNQGSNEIVLDPKDFVAITSDPEPQESQPQKAKRFVLRMLERTTISPGSTLKGKLVFDISEKDSQLLLRWQPEGISTPTSVLVELSQ